MSRFVVFFSFCFSFSPFLFFLEVYDDAARNLSEELFHIGDEWKGVEGLMEEIQALKKRESTV